MTDCRAGKYPVGKRIYQVLAEYDKYFDEVGWTDGFLALFPARILKDIEITNQASAEGSNTWPVINKQLIAAGRRQLRLKESLCFHVGNAGSVMNKQERDVFPIRTIKTNLNDLPKILKK